MSHVLFNANSLKAKFEKTKQRYKSRSGGATVGFAQQYSSYVHENLDVYHKVGQAKYLEQPAREMRRELADIVKTTMKKKDATLDDGLLKSALALLRRAKQLVPIDTGALKLSGFACYKWEVPTVSAMAFARAQAHRLAVLSSRKLSRKKRRKR